MARPKNGKNTGATDVATNPIQGAAEALVDAVATDTEKDLLLKAKQALVYADQLKYIDELLKVGVDDAGYRKWLLGHQVYLEAKVAELQAFIYQTKFEANLKLRK